eukprot:TRINITY_DN3034_c0_g1_i2.p1 TRINITY_DN3034_c0_g1~~TRINITY_DN3034_c0_g1_i2.p1  ORF type:complete len:419 (+),score=41.96 TRINITY_DN3034_c0_g1_i2:129-1385(+)
MMKRPVPLLPPFILLLLSSVCFAWCASTGAAATMQCPHPGQTPSTQFQLVRFDGAETGARCIDGTGAGFYYHCGSGSDADKWIIWLVGGGYCIASSPRPDIQDCRVRVGTAQGSSAHWANTTNQAGVPLISNNQTLNPDFYAWSKIVIPYCSGDLYSGTNNQSVSGMYQNGHNIIAATFATLKNAGFLPRIKELILSGGSAGGFGAHINIDYVRRVVPSSAPVSVLPNAGWFINVEPYPGSGKTPVAEVALLLYKSALSYANVECSKDNVATPWLCLTGNVSYPYWGKTVRTFIAENIYDINQIFGQDGVPAGKITTKECPYVRNFGATMISTLDDVIKSPQAGIYAPACFLHGVDTAERVPGVGGYSLQTMFNDWYFSRPNTAFPTYKAVDPCWSPQGKLSCNPTCHSQVDTSACDA